ncbi:MAG TPA: LysM peptidoglycan-binding domain-containing protein [Anaerolineae bacterium]|nr:LysM peptidoglycan-binding domain-containing protein [Anaerolineae bacterium]
MKRTARFNILWLLIVMMSLALLSACTRDAPAREPIVTATPGGSAPVINPAPTTDPNLLPIATVDPNAGQLQPTVDPNVGQPQPTVDPNAGQPQPTVDPNAGQPQPTAVPPTSGGQTTNPTPPPTSQTDENGNPIYQIQQGDTLFSIATRYGLTVNDLVVANRIANPNNIVPGETIIIPVNPTSASDEIVHIVRAGETIFSIAQLYGVDMDTLISYNNITNPNLIDAGAEIRIPPAQ